MATLSEKTSPSGGPCDGIRVIDVSALVSGPYCSQILADLGAEVIRVEAEGSDVMRFNPPIHHEISAYFQQVNRGKKSVSVDLKSDAGREIVRRLVESADVFLQNSRPGVMERLGLGYDDLRGINPRLIYVSISGFGENGPFARRAAYDGVIQGLTGFLPIQGGEAGPQAVRCPVADKVTAMWASNATLAALLHRAQNGGQGQKVLVNMTAAYSAFMLLDAMQNHTFLSQEHEPVTLSYDVYRTLRTGDGEVIGLVLQPAQLKGFCEALGRTDLLSDPRFSDSVLLVRNARALYEAVAAEVRQLSTAEFLERMADKSVPFARVNTIDEFLGSDEAKYSGAYIDFEDPELGVVRNLNYPAQFERTPTQAGRRAPKLGEHNKEILGALEKK